ncbi:MAG TPA: hypothetical protein VNT32_00495 [Thermoleophilaceae bacterium]|nr:hypothetical protein [Thermoleophilaceae bacterium]
MARIAIDIDSTLHHYWDLFSRIVRERHGIELPYERQRTWGVAELERDELVDVVRESHSEDNILAADPYPGAVETVQAWREEGHWIHITSHRAVTTQVSTERWLTEIGLPYDDLHCSWDKVTRCTELEIDLLVDDSPVNIERALEAGIACATLRHPWNEELEGTDGVILADDWTGLRTAVAPLLGG